MVRRGVLLAFPIFGHVRRFAGRGDVAGSFMHCQWTAPCCKASYDSNLGVQASPWSSSSRIARQAKGRFMGHIYDSPNCVQPLKKKPGLLPVLLKHARFFAVSYMEPDTGQQPVTWVCTHDIPILPVAIQRARLLGLPAFCFWPQVFHNVSFAHVALTNYSS